MELDEEDLRQGIARHAKCYTDTKIDPSEAVAGMKKALARWSESTAIGRVEV